MQKKNTFFLGIFKRNLILPVYLMKYLNSDKPFIMIDKKLNLIENKGKVSFFFKCVIDHLVI